MYRIVFLLLSSLFFTYCSNKENITLPYYNSPDFTPLFISEKENIDQIITHHISDFSFLNEDSTFITQQNIEGKIHVANFIFTTCGSICPSMTSNMKIISDSVINNKNIVLLSYSVTPWIDSPSVLKKYKETHGIKNKNWFFLTGSKNDIYEIARQAYFAEEDIGFSRDSSTFLHTEHFILVDPNKRIRGVYNGTLAFEMAGLLEDIHTLETETTK